MPDVYKRQRGNCDSEVDQMVLKFPILADYLLLAIGKKTIFVTHGHLYNKNNLPPLNKGDILLCGHTHICLLYTSELFSAIFLFNLGITTLAIFIE